MNKELLKKVSVDSKLADKSYKEYKQWMRQLSWKDDKLHQT